LSGATDAGKLFAAAVREQPLDLGLACSLIAAAADPTASVTEDLAALDAFAALARPLLRNATSAAAQAEALQDALGKQAGFAGFAEDYQDLRSSLLPKVLRRRRGLPILLSVVWVEVARRLSVPAYLVALPGHVIVGVGDPAGEYVLVDPFHGGRTLTVHDAAERVRAAGATFHHSQLAPAPAVAVVLRVLGNIRLLAAERGDTATRLWATRLSLAVPGRPAALRRELGELLGRLGDHLGGARELDGYADDVQAAEPSAAATARRNAQMLRARLN
jgi:regulator of sirC expression with transglutaminase-like and TPR domain